jgi:hypothetical protein
MPTSRPSNSKTDRPPALVSELAQIRGLWTAARDDGATAAGRRAVTLPGAGVGVAAEAEAAVDDLAG